MLNIEQIEKSKMVTEPFKYSIITECFPKEYLIAILNKLPVKNYFRSTRDFGSDKVYNVMNNLLLKLGDDNYNIESDSDPALIAFIEAIKSKEYNSAISNLIEEDLSGCYLEVTLKKYGYQDFISAHTDSQNVKATHMFFLNRYWDPNWGGQLCLMHDKKNSFLEISPTIDKSLVFVRSNNSWHSVSPITHKDIERIAIQVAFWKTTERNILPGRIDNYLNETE